MKAVIAQSFGTPYALTITEIEPPLPNDHEVQIAVKYAAVNPVDWKILEGYLDFYPHEFPFIPGWDASGVIRKKGKNVHAFNLGDEVYCYCRKPVIKWGTYAEYVNVEASLLALKPINLTFAQAAGIPLAGLTAWQALFDAGKLDNGEKVLIHAGAGGVGSLAIQFAKQAGAFVIATASKQSQKYVKELGADLIIDYTKEDFSGIIYKHFPEGIELVLDTIGGEICRRSMTVLKHRGRLVSLLEQFKEGFPQDINCSFLFVEPSGKQLQKIATLIEKGIITAPSIEEMPLAKVQKALEKSKSGHVQGKIVLNVHAT